MLDLKCCGEAPEVSTALASVLGESERPSHASNRQQRKCKRYSVVANVYMRCILQ